MKSFGVVSQFEKAVAEFSGAKHGIAVNTGTSALFLSMKYAARGFNGAVTFPAQTFVSVPMAAIHAGLRIKFEDEPWAGVYTIDPLNVIDGALRFHRGMYRGGLHCISFQARKLLNIGEGGMILTDDDAAAAWLRKARYSGRGGADGKSFAIEDINMIGWQMYMTPEKAARGLHLMEYVADDLPDQVMTYPDLRLVKAFAPYIEDSPYLSGTEFGLPASCMVHRMANIAGSIKAGENCRIDAFVTVTGNVTLGDNCHLANGCAIFGTEGVEIGDDSSISPGAQIFTTSFDRKTRHRANPMVKDKAYGAAKVTIGARCIIGASSVVLPGAVVRDDTCIGALSLVRADHAAGLWAGIPVRRIA